MNGTKVRVFDYISDFTGTIVSGGVTLSPGADGTIKYIDDSIQYDGTDWDFVSGNSYPWTRTGTHNFFGWTTKTAETNASANAALEATSLFGTAGDNDNTKFGFIYSSKTLNIPATTMTTATPQLDFCYSSIVQKTSSYRDPVEIPFHHLFTGLCLELENLSDDKIHISNVVTRGIANTKSATIPFSGNGIPAPVYTKESTGNIIPASIWSSPVTIENKDCIDLWTGNTFTTDAQNHIPNYILMWPQDYTADICGNNVDTPAGIVITYTIEDVQDEHGDDIVFTATINFKDIESLKDSQTGFLAGHRYLLSLQFQGYTFIVKLRADDWDYVPDDMNYSDSAIAANSSGGYHGGALWLYNGAEDENNSLGDSNNKPRVIPMEMGDAFTGVFYIEAPTEGNWKVDLTPYEASQYFEITPSEGGLISTDNGGRTEFTIKAKGNIPTTETAYFKILISIHGEWRDANSEFNRKNWGVRRTYE